MKSATPCLLILLLCCGCSGGWLDPTMTFRIDPQKGLLYKNNKDAAGYAKNLKITRGDTTFEAEIFEITGNASDPRKASVDQLGALTEMGRVWADVFKAGLDTAVRYQSLRPPPSTQPQRPGTRDELLDLLRDLLEREGGGG